MRGGRSSSRAPAAARGDRHLATPDASDGRRRTALSGTASRATSSSAGSGKRKRPGGHRRAESRRAFPTIPAVAGVATLVVAASSALTLNSGLLTMSPAGATGALAAGAPLTLGQLQDERAASADRADRSRREAADTVADARARAEALAADKERAAWALKHDQELQSVRQKAAGVTDEQVFRRVIQWFLPLRSFKLSSGFGQPGVLWANDHTGQDFAAPQGAPIRAVGSGEIIYAAYDGPFGNKVIIRHNDGTETWYCHMSGFEVTGGYVRAGTTIGYVGSTGNSTGPHLHLEVHPGGGDPIDPLPWLRELGLPI